MNAVRPPGLETDEAATLAGAAASGSETQEILPLENSAPLPDDQEFDWSRDTLIHKQPAIAIYFNPHGHVIVRQAVGWPDDDVWVSIDPAHLGTVIDRLEQLKREAWG